MLWKAETDTKCMLDRRVETRMLCADLVDLQWKDKTEQQSHVCFADNVSGDGTSTFIEKLDHGT